MPIITALTLFTLNLIANVILHCFHMQTAVLVADLPATDLMHLVVNEYRDRQSTLVIQLTDDVSLNADSEQLQTARDD